MISSSSFHLPLSFPLSSTSFFSILFPPCSSLSLESGEQLHVPLASLGEAWPPDAVFMYLKTTRHFSRYKTHTKLYSSEKNTQQNIRMTDVTLCALYWALTWFFWLKFFFCLVEVWISQTFSESAHATGNRKNTCTVSLPIDSKRSLQMVICTGRPANGQYPWHVDHCTTTAWHWTVRRTAVWVWDK